MSVLVTGGAGYIGAHVVRLLRERGDSVVVVDDLSTGTRDRIGDVPFVELDLSREDAGAGLEAAFAEHDVRSVIHVAAKKQVGESAQRPAWYYRQNVGGMAILLQAMQNAGVDSLMFSSSAATYGLPDVAPGELMGEDVTAHPISVYGETKLVGEWMMRASAAAWGLRAVGLRYFNVAGAGWPELGDPGVYNLVPLVLRALTTGGQPSIFGTDYPTDDGTCVRDYVHVLDLADAHLAALDYLARDERPYDVFNVGSGSGSSVREVLAAVGAATGYDIAATIAERRVGDPPFLVADVTRIHDTLGWKATHDLQEMAASAWAAWQVAPGTA